MPRFIVDLVGGVRKLCNGPRVGTCGVKGLCYRIGLSYMYIVYIGTIHVFYIFYIIHTDTLGVDELTNIFSAALSVKDTAFSM